MPHYEFDSMLDSYVGKDKTRDPVTFGLLGRTFTVNPDPSLGDTFELANVPGEFNLTADGFDPNDESHVAQTAALYRFIGRMIVAKANADAPDEGPATTADDIAARAAWFGLQYDLKARGAGIVWDIAEMIKQEAGISKRPSEPSSSSLDGRSGTGPTSRRRTAGTAKRR